MKNIFKFIIHMPFLIILALLVQLFYNQYNVYKEYSINKDGISNQVLEKTFIIFNTISENSLEMLNIVSYLFAFYLILSIFTISNSIKDKISDKEYISKFKLKLTTKNKFFHIPMLILNNIFSIWYLKMNITKNKKYRILFLVNLITPMLSLTLILVMIQIQHNEYMNELINVGLIKENTTSIYDNLIEYSSHIIFSLIFITCIFISYFKPLSEK